MNVFSSLLANAKSFDTETYGDALDRIIRREIKELISEGDATSPGAAYEARDELQAMFPNDATGGTFDLTIGTRINGVVSNTLVENIAYNASAATIQTAVDSALSGVAGYTAGDIYVFAYSGGTANNDFIDFEYSGDSVTNVAQPLSNMDGTNLVGGALITLVRNNGGQPDRPVWAAFKVLDLVDFGGSPPSQYGTLPILTNIINRADSPFSEPTLRALALEAEVQDNIPGLKALLLYNFNLTP